jgi:XTP/dITP diphosphohydrolase
VKAVLLATRNEGKIREFRQLLAGEPLTVETLAAHEELGDVEETGKTFEENAVLKASHFARATGLWTIAEDSGLVVDALGGAPGVLSARYAGVHGDDAANNARLIAELQGKEDRRARYVCSLVLAQPDGTIAVSVQGVCEGHIVDQPRGTGGFGYDPHFITNGESRTNAELPPRDKNAISHRGQALRGFMPLLRVHLSGPGAS